MHRLKLNQVAKTYILEHPPTRAADHIDDYNDQSKELTERKKHTVRKMNRQIQSVDYGRLNQIIFILFWSKLHARSLAG
jgi:hypothetical protein